MKSSQQIYGTKQEEAVVRLVQTDFIGYRNRGWRSTERTGKQDLQEIWSFVLF